MTTILSEEQLHLRESARDFLANEYPMSWVREWMEAEPEQARAMAGPLWQQLAELGWLGLQWPEELGGVELGFVEQVIVLEELGRALLPSAYLSTLIASCIIDRAAEDAVRREILTAVCAGERVLSFALAEASGEEPDGFEVRAQKSGNGYTLHGTKLFVADADVADQLLVAARTGETTSWLLVDTGTASGFEIERLETMDQTRPLHRVAFEATPATLVGGEGDFARIWSEVEPYYWTALAAEGVGGSQRVLEDSVEYAKERVQFDKPIGVNQAIKHRCADMLIHVEGARAITYYAARELENASPDARLAASMAKAHATEAYRAVAEDGMQIYGGVGFTWEYDIHFYYKHARAIEITAGHPDEHRERIAVGAGL